MSRQHYYKPMLALAAQKAFTDKDWIFEIKWDGFRAIAYVEKQFSLRSRNGKELKGNFPELAQLTQLGTNIVVDGEIVVMQEGKPDFQALLERGQSVSAGEIQRQAMRSPAIYIVFDILEKDGAPVTQLPLTERKKILAQSLKEGTNVVISDYIEGQGEAYFQLILEKGLEGIVAKKKDSRYEEGLRSGSWLKVKKLKTCDCVIFGYTQGSQSRGETFGALVLGLYDEEKKPVYVGKVGTGFSQRTLGLLMDKFEKIKTDVAPFNAEAGDVVTWLLPQLVCEVHYQVVTKDGRLRMARFKRLREDKPPEQCTLDQLNGTQQAQPQKNSTQTNMDSKLSEYSSKRDFQETPEPKGGNKKQEPQIFVVQEHHARRLHYDLRLESGGVLKSWAVPKGIPEASNVRHLAVETEDHPYEYASFEGEIPKGHYGAGTVKIWDKGHYQTKLWEKDKIEVTLTGQRLQGRYVLVRLKNSEDQKNWLLLKGKESHE
ncbi:MAG TPA: non-homologous end-joining DNA ligase [Candidatus Deferrimicrobiaceae bacterium]|nr:non-homologous end-joining DNA ligase [Candidatus Deferrimicrobiaceae bacterium]